MTENLPIKIGKISKKLWPRKIYIKAKDTHPILGSTILVIWTIFWALIAILLNLLFIIIILGTIFVFLYAIFGDSTYDATFLHIYPDRKKKEKNHRSDL